MQKITLKFEFWLYNFYGLISRVIAFFLIKFDFAGLDKLKEFWMKAVSLSLHEEYFSSRPDDFLPNENSLTLFLRNTFLVGEDTLIDVHKKFKVDSTALPIGSTLMYAVCRRDEKRLRNSFRKRKEGQGVLGSKSPYNPLHRIGSFVGIKVNGEIYNLYDIEKGSSSSYEKLFVTALVNPRDWVIVGDDLWILTNPNILIIKKDGSTTRIVNKLFSDQHSIRFHSKKHQVVMTSTGNDIIFFIDTKTKQIVREWSAIKNGFHHVLGKEKLMLTYKGIGLKDTQTVPSGYELIQISDTQVLRTPRQIFHPNSAIFDDKEKDIIYFTAFGSKNIVNGDVIQQGSGGKVVAIKDNVNVVDVVTGLSNPHGLRTVGQLNGKRVFMLTESSKGTINFYIELELFKWDLLGKFSINDIPGVRFEPKLPWIMDCAININNKTGDVVMSFYDGERLGIHILNISNNGNDLKRWFISTSETFSIQRVCVYI